MVLMTSSAAVFACHSAACAPPSAGGTGGSIAGKGPAGGRVAGRPTGNRGQNLRSKKSGAASGGTGTETAKAGSKATLPGAKTHPTSALHSELKKAKTADTPDEAVEALKSGKGIKVKGISAARTMTSKLAALMEKRKGPDGKVAGKDEINMCKVSLPGTNLFCSGAFDIPRKDMPQLSGKPVPGSRADKMAKEGKVKLDKDGEAAFDDEFATYLKEKGIKFETDRVPSSSLSASQTELKASKALGMADNEGYDPGAKPIYVSKDGYVIDGHHRWAAMNIRDLRDGKLGDAKINVIRVDMNIHDALHTASQFAEDFGIAPKSL